MSNNEQAIRKRILSIYNKSRPEFVNTPEWYDYQELIEDKVFNLVEGIDVKQTETQIAEYLAANRSTILQNEARKADAQRMAAACAAGQGTLQLDSNPADSSTPRPSAAKAARLPPPSHDQMTPEQRRAMAVASGWDEPLCRRRDVEEAFCSILV